jgi:hypothetical protein
VNADMRQAVCSKHIKVRSVAVMHIQTSRPVSQRIHLDDVLGRGSVRCVERDWTAVRGPAFHTGKQVRQRVVDDGNQAAHVLLREEPMQHCTPLAVQGVVPRRQDGEMLSEHVQDCLCPFAAQVRGLGVQLFDKGWVVDVQYMGPVESNHDQQAQRTENMFSFCRHNE